MALPLLQNYINGQLCAGNGLRRGDVFDPALGQKTKQVYLSNAADVDQAARAAKQAFVSWSKTTPLKRARIIFAFNQLVQEHIDELAALLTSEHGKVLSDAKGEMIRGIEVIEYACGIPSLIRGAYAEDVGTGIDSYSIPQPVGVCVGITPFNFPAMVPLWMLVMSIACGNTFILKPSERDPSVSLRLAELFTQAGLPQGVFNVIQGDKEAVDALLQHPDIKAISFVGATPTAQYIYREAALHGKRVQALGGAKNHCVVMPDADLDLVSDGLVGAAYGSTGQRCMAISVAVIVGDATADQVIDKIKQRLSGLKVLPGNVPDADMGPLITQQQLTRVKGLVTEGVAEGASLVMDGRELSVPHYEQGFFMGPCLFDHVTPDMRIYQEEIFGPVLCVMRVPTLAAAMNLINENPYGNGTAIYTESGAVAREFVSNIQVGMVGVNVPIPVPMAFFSFGGWKQSFFGDTHAHGSEAIKFYTRLKNVTSRWPEPHMAGIELTMPTLG